MTILGQQSFEPVLEKYVGRSKHKKEFDIIERELSKIIKKIKRDYAPFADRVNRGKFIVKLNADKLNNSEQNRLIEAQFKKIFNLKDFTLIWNVSDTVNAYTVCKSFIFLDNNFKEDKKGHRTNDRLFVGVNIYTGLITYSNLNEKELIGIILHEIGHNFYNSIFHTLSSLPLDMRKMGFEVIVPTTINHFAIRGITDAISFNENYMKAKREINNFLYRHFPGVLNVINTITDTYHNIMGVFGNSFDTVMAFIKNLPNIAMNPARMLFNYNVEKHADSFAVDYGYGPYLSSALAKLNLNENSLSSKVYRIPGYNWMLDFFDLQLNIISSCLSGYPIEQNRIKTSLDRLKQSAKDPTIDIKTKRELNKQIEMFEDWYYNDYLSISNDNNKRRIFTWLYRNAVEKVFKGKADIRELIHALDPKKYA